MENIKNIISVYDIVLETKNNNGKCKINDLKLIYEQIRKYRNKLEKVEFTTVLEQDIRWEKIEDLNRILIEIYNLVEKKSRFNKKNVMNIVDLILLYQHSYRGMKGLKIKK